MQDYFAILVQSCSEAEARAATENTKPMTSLRTEQQIDELAVKRIMEQTTELVGITPLRLVPPDASGDPEFRIISQSVSNSDDPQTYNRIVSMGYNNADTHFHGNFVPGKPTALMVWEYNYRDDAGEYGPELVLEFCNTERPFYARQIFTAAETTIAAGSDGATLPQATINVASTTKFPQYGSFTVRGETIAYTGKTATSLTGCSGGSVTLATGDAVESVFRSNNTVHIDIGTDGSGSFSLFAGKLNTAIMTGVAEGITIRPALTVVGTLVMPDSIINADSNPYKSHDRYYSEDHAGGSTATIPANAVDVFRARQTTSGALTFAAPTDPTVGQVLRILLGNRFGGVTVDDPIWNAAFSLASTWSPAPSPGTYAWIQFWYDGDKWVEQTRGAALQVLVA